MKNILFSFLIISIKLIKINSLYIYIKGKEKGCVKKYKKQNEVINIIYSISGMEDYDRNIITVDNFLKERLPKVKLIYPEGTYLLWLDFRELNLSDEEIEKILLNEAKLWLDSGKMFGELGKGFQRMNIALPKDKLYMALLNLEKAFKNREL